ncbi:enoyl-CoA hydratase/isomerase family protein [Haloactinomyces albus]|uniref:Enoyl-CoA hydratase/carnithine racemase n=1 Tax=Haloactinomyces albus TaxID=1352928 RepID=A0AAE4CP96_9ACTN|nr:enoyl-CoA hydratase/isomerase family protein [Haloactinomyces albus]MDR7304196.1 enoyl-CoA hydratase/carnithine racemase [Haloactinomyces albus]
MSAEPSSAGELLTVRLHTPIAEITIGNGTKRNALPGAEWTRLQHSIQELAEGGTTRAIVLRGHSGTFCAGSDMTEWVGAGAETVEDSFARMEAAFRAIEKCPIPVVAEIHGVAAGAGCQLALACDLRFMADSARIGMPIARLGIQTSPAFAARMVALAGPSLTRQLLYTGRLLDASAAVHAGLAEHHLPEAELGEHTARVLTAITEQPPAAVRAAKRAVAATLAPTREATRHNDQTAVALTDFRNTMATLFP